MDKYFYIIVSVPGSSSYQRRQSPVVKLEIGGFVSDGWIVTVALNYVNTFNL